MYRHHDINNSMSMLVQSSLLRPHRTREYCVYLLRRNFARCVFFYFLLLF